MAKAIATPGHAPEVISAAIPLVNEVISRGNVRIQETGVVALGLIGRFVLYQMLDLHSSLKPIEFLKVFGRVDAVRGHPRVDRPVG